MCPAVQKWEAAIKMVFFRFVLTAQSEVEKRERERERKRERERERERERDETFIIFFSYTLRWWKQVLTNFWF